MRNIFYSIVTEAKGGGKESSPKTLKIEDELDEDFTPEEDTKDQEPDEEPTGDDPEEIGDEDSEADKEEDFTDNIEDIEVNDENNTEQENNEETNEGALEDDSLESDPEEDFTDNIDDGNGDSAPTDENQDDQPQEDPDNEDQTGDDIKNNNLLDDLMRLESMIENFKNRLSEKKSDDVKKISQNNQVINNLTELQKQVYNYIVYKFSSNTYVKNLYIYNYFVEALNILLKMVQKINSFKDNN